MRGRMCVYVCVCVRARKRGAEEERDGREREGGERGRAERGEWAISVWESSDENKRVRELKAIPANARSGGIGWWRKREKG